MVTFTDILDAYQRLHGISRRTPLLTSEKLDQHVQGRVFVKAEVLQHSGSFKFRGAYNKICQLAQQGITEVLAYSSGNHAQGVAMAARKFQMTAVILMPSNAPKCKIENTKALGAEVILYDRQTQDRDQLGNSLAERRELTLVKPFDDPDIIAGQGTLGLEICQELQILGETPGHFIMPCGGGGLLSGSAIAIHQNFPEVRIWSAEPENHDDTERSLAAGERLHNTNFTHSICDAIVTPAPGEITFPILSNHLSGGVSVTDEQVQKAMAFCLNELKIVVEPSGAVALAALIAGKIDIKGKTTVIVASGGNVDAHTLINAVRKYGENPLI